MLRNMAFVSILLLISSVEARAQDITEENLKVLLIIGIIFGVIFSIIMVIIIIHLCYYHLMKGGPQENKNLVQREKSTDSTKSDAGQIKSNQLGGRFGDLDSKLEIQVHVADISMETLKSNESKAKDDKKSSPSPRSPFKKCSYSKSPDKKLKGVPKSPLSPTERSDKAPKSPTEDSTKAKDLGKFFEKKKIKKTRNEKQKD